MNSRWLQKHEAEVKKLQTQGKSEKKKGLLIAIVIMGVLLVLAMFTSGAINPAENPQALSAMAFIGGTFVFVILMVTLLSKKNANRDVASALRKQLEELLTTSELVEQFDQEMLNAPLDEIECGGNDHIYFTEHYIHSSFWDFTNLPDHRFVRLCDVREMRFAISKDETKALGLGKLFMVDLLDASGSKCMGLSIHGRERMDEFEALLEKYCPGIILQEHTLF